MSRAPVRVDLGGRAIKYDFVPRFTLTEAEDPSDAADLLNLNTWSALPTPAATLTSSAAPDPQGHDGLLVRLGRCGMIMVCQGNAGEWVSAPCC
jgi:hypothetical protein